MSTDTPAAACPAGSNRSYWLHVCNSYRLPAAHHCQLLVHLRTAQRQHHNNGLFKKCGNTYYLQTCSRLLGNTAAGSTQVGGLPTSEIQTEKM